MRSISAGVIDAALDRATELKLLPAAVRSQARDELIRHEAINSSVVDMQRRYRMPSLRQ